MHLNGKQRRQLRALGHHLEPVVIVGQQGVTPGIVSATEQALFDHELIKVKFNESPVEAEAGAEQLARDTGAEVAQVLGHTALLYKEHPDKPKIDLGTGRVPPPPSRMGPKGTPKFAPGHSGGPLPGGTTPRTRRSSGRGR